ncbi:MAG: hypothetical protein HY606_05905 [Planctomycetes bacterium]|nr:hypothetical protein [Planctomycetota bacterium]
MKIFARLMVLLFVVSVIVVENSWVAGQQSGNKPCQCGATATIYTEGNVSVVVIEPYNPFPTLGPLGPNIIAYIAPTNSIGLIGSDDIDAICAMDPPLDLTRNPCIDK